MSVFFSWNQEKEKEPAPRSNRGVIKTLNRVWFTANCVQTQVDSCVSSASFVVCCATINGKSDQSVSGILYLVRDARSHWSLLQVESHLCRSFAQEQSAAAMYKSFISLYLTRKN